MIHKDGTMPWICPHCKSPALFIYFSERRCAPIDQTIAIEPTPDLNSDDFVDGPFNLNVVCNACGMSEIEPVRSEEA